MNVHAHARKTECPIEEELLRVFFQETVEDLLDTRSTRKRLGQHRAGVYKMLVEVL